MRPRSSKPATTAEMRAYHCAYVSRMAPSTTAKALGSRSTLERKLLPRSSIGRTLPQSFGGIHGRGHDGDIAGTAAQMAAEEFAHLVLGRVRLTPEIAVERHQDAGGTEAALQGVMAAEGFLQHGETAGLRRQPFHGADRCAVGLHRQRETGAGGHAVYLDGAGAADAVLAAD